MNRSEYLDNTATTPIDERVLSIITSHLEKTSGNPSSLHTINQLAERVLDESRCKMAEILDAEPSEIIFTSCGSESDNLTLQGGGSACKTGNSKPSPVLTHLGYSKECALGSLRVSLGKDTTAEEVSHFLDILPTCVKRVREAAI